MTWLELANLPKGTRIQFMRTWDLSPTCIVLPGTSAVIVDQCLNDRAALWIAPELATMRQMLADWDGILIVDGPDNPNSPEWQDEAPFTLAD